MSLDQLIALNDELAALSRAGVPLEKGLIHLGGDLPWKLGRVASSLGRRLEGGQTLPQALKDETEIPDAYRALVAAGIRSGRLTSALEAISSLLRRAAETRRLIAVAMIYPVLLVVVAYALLVFSTTKTMPPVVEAWSDWSHHSGALSAQRWLETIVSWGMPLLPWILGALILAWWIRVRYVTSLDGGRSGRKHRWWSTHAPTVRGTLQAGRMATFAETLAVLIENEIPLTEAVPLAAGASGDRRLSVSARDFASRLCDGTDTPTLAAAPPMLAWVLGTAHDQKGLVRALHRIADSYHRRAQWMSRWLSVFLPVLLTTCVGGSVVVVYALATIWPWSSLLCEIAKGL
jgi:general secretion pathway protein F